MLDITGCHEVHVEFCRCRGAPPHHIQLLRQKWFPSVGFEPHTAATFRLLRHFHLLSAHLGISAVEFYENIVHMTDNTGLHPPIVSYSFKFVQLCRPLIVLQNRSAAFVVMTEEWGRLKSLKRSGIPTGDPLIESEKKYVCS